VAKKTKKADEQTLETTTIECAVCKAVHPLGQMIEAARRGNYSCTCGRIFTPSDVVAVRAKVWAALYVGFPFQRPIVPTDRRKNGAAAEFSDYIAESVHVAPPSTEQVEAVRRHYLANLDERADCPTCGRSAERQHRKLSSGMGLWLIELTKLSVGDVFVHTAEVLKSIGGNRVVGSDATSILPLYGLIEEGAIGDPGVDPGKGRTNGYWRPTSLGRQFVDGQVHVPARVVTCLSIPERFEGPAVNIRDVLAAKFSYEEAMGKSTPPAE